MPETESDADEKRVEGSGEQQAELETKVASETGEKITEAAEPPTTTSTAQPIEPANIVVKTDTPVVDPPGRWRALGLMMISMVCCLSPWFGATAAMSEFKLLWGIDDAAAGILTVMVQFGFLVGACASAFLGIADVVPPRRLFFVGGLSAAVVNLLLLVPNLTYGSACVLRFLTGVAMAFVYPPGMKAAATWFKRGRGLGLGAMVGALCIGSALPHVIVGVPWQVRSDPNNKHATTPSIDLLCDEPAPPSNLH